MYEVETNKRLSDNQIKELSEGVVISTTIQRDSGDKKNGLTFDVKTLPCYVKRIVTGKDRTLQDSRY